MKGRRHLTNIVKFQITIWAGFPLPAAHLKIIMRFPVTKAIISLPELPAQCLSMRGTAKPAAGGCERHTLGLRAYLASFEKTPPGK